MEEMRSDVLMKDFFFLTCLQQSTCDHCLLFFFLLWCIINTVFLLHLRSHYASMEKQQGLTFGKCQRFCVQRKMFRVKEHVSL